MDNANANKSIKCTVTSCQNHNTQQDYCSLESVSIGTHEPHPTQCRCVDCEDFTLRNDL